MFRSLPLDEGHSHIVFTKSITVKSCVTGMTMEKSAINNIKQNVLTYVLNKTLKIATANIIIFYRKNILCV